MGVLDVVDRVLGALLLGQLDVQVDPGRGRPRAEVPARRVRPDLGQQLVEADELAGALAHADLDAVAHEADPGHQHPLHRLGIESQRPGGSPVARHRPVVVLAPEVDQLREAAAELLRDVAEVRRKVGGLAVRADDDPILVVPERRRAEPGRSIGLVDVPVVAQLFDRAGHPSLLVDRPLAGPHVEAHAESGEALLDPGANPLRGPPAKNRSRHRRPAPSPRPRSRRGPVPQARPRSRRDSRPREPRRPRAGPAPTGRGSAPAR